MRPRLCTVPRPQDAAELVTSTGRDAAIGGMAGHVHKDHEQERAAGTKGPSMGDKVSGGLDKMVGKATNNPNKVAEGQAKTGTL